MSQKTLDALKQLEMVANERRDTATKMTAQAYDASLITTLDNDLLLQSDERALYIRTYQRVMQETGDEMAARQAAVGAVRRMRLEMPVKAVKWGKDWIVKAWGALFTDSNYPDTDKEYFPRNGRYYLDYFKNAPFWYEHGQDARYGVEPIGQRVHHIVYSTGIYVFHKLDTKHAHFEETVEDLRTGLMCLSSDSLWHFKVRGETIDGGNFVWPMAGWSLVKRPAEPGLGNALLEEPEDA